MACDRRIFVAGLRSEVILEARINFEDEAVDAITPVWNYLIFTDFVKG